MLTLEYARDAAHAELDLAQIRQIRVALIERMSAFGEFQAEPAFNSVRELKRFLYAAHRAGVNAPIPVKPAPIMPAAEPERLAEAVSSRFARTAQA